MKNRKKVYVEREEFTLDDKDVGRYVVKSSSPIVARRVASALRRIMEGDGYIPKRSDSGAGSGRELKRDR